jgi:hypothetical protein
MYMAVWYSLWSFGILFPFGFVWTNQEKSGNPGPRRRFFLVMIARSLLPTCYQLLNRACIEMLDENKSPPVGGKKCCHRTTLTENINNTLLNIA